MHVYPINLNTLALKWILDLFCHFLQQPKIILMQEWIFSDASVNCRDFCSKEESLLGDGNSVLELCFLWPVWTLDFGLLWKWQRRAIPWNRVTVSWIYWGFGRGAVQIKCCFTVQTTLKSCTEHWLVQQFLGLERAISNMLEISIAGCWRLR